MSLSTPILFLIFNRLDTTKQVFSKIRQIQPLRLYIAADGYRPECQGEAEKIQEIRDYVIDQIDWDCEVKTLFREQNLGCRIAVSTAIDWFFLHEPEGIILEDDCLPTQSFFFFCQTLLEHFRNDTRVMHISGNNFQSSKQTNSYSYLFTKYGGIWGWASWRRAWQHYDRDMKNWLEVKHNNLIDYVYDDWAEKMYWTNIFDRVVKGIPNTWDYQWLYARWMQHELSIAPAVNLVSNIGFGADATHTSYNNHLASMETEDVWELKHPPFFTRDCLSDTYLFDYCYGGKRMKQYGRWIEIIRQKLVLIKN
jgi:hypothetical protein